MESNIRVAGETYISSPFLAAKESVSRLLHTNLKSVILVTILMFVTVFGLAIVIAGLALLGYFTNGMANNTWTLGLMYFFLGTLVILGILYLSIVLTVAYAYLYANSQNLKSVSVRSALKRGTKRAWVMLFASIISGLFVIAGLIALIIPGLYLMLRLAYVYPIVATEDVGAIEAVKRSFDLTKGNLWDIIGISSFALILSLGVSVFINSWGLLFNNLAVDTTLAIADVATSFIIGIFTTAFIYFRYHQSDLEKRSEIEKVPTHGINYLLPIAALPLLLASMVVSMDSTDLKDNTLPEATDYSDAVSI